MYVFSETEHSVNSFRFNNFVVLHVKTHIQSFDRVVSKSLTVKITLSCSVYYIVLWRLQCETVFTVKLSTPHFTPLYRVSHSLPNPAFI